MVNQVTITLTPELMGALEKYQEKMGYEKKTQAIRQLIRIGLKEAKPIE
jgi:metal-responsive CopG/Arc/MetJ family transcriptional regulator